VRGTLNIPKEEKRRVNKEMKTKMIAAFIVTLMALSIFGFAYSAWRDNVYINGTVHMGELIVGILAEGEPPYVDVIETTNGVPEEEFCPPKPWVANTTVTLEDFETSVHHEPPQTVAHTMIITVDNAYPQYDVHIKGVLKNAGTIPAKLSDCHFEGYDTIDDEELRYTGEWTWNSTLECWVFEGEIWDNGPDNTWDTDDDVVIINLYITVFAPEDMQLEPCNPYTFLIDFDFKQDAEECHTYTFKASFEFIQWNKWGIPE